MQVIIPKWENKFQISKVTRASYYSTSQRDKLPKKYLEGTIKTYFIRNKEVLGNEEGPFIKNTKSVGKPKFWVLNGQDLYNAMLDWRRRKIVAQYYHHYFSIYIKEQLRPILFNSSVIGVVGLSISCDIYEIKRGQIPDVSNMWLLEKFFEDALQECGIIPDDSPDYVIESGRKRYHWVTNPDDRKLIFNIEFINL